MRPNFWPEFFMFSLNPGDEVTSSKPSLICSPNTIISPLFVAWCWRFPCLQPASSSLRSETWCCRVVMLHYTVVLENYPSCPNAPHRAAKWAGLNGITYGVWVQCEAGSFRESWDGWGCHWVYCSVLSLARRPEVSGPWTFSRGPSQFCTASILLFVQTLIQWTVQTRSRGSRISFMRPCRSTAHPTGSTNGLAACLWPSPCCGRLLSMLWRTCCSCTAGTVSPSTSCCWRCWKPKSECFLFYLSGSVDYEHQDTTCPLSSCFERTFRIFPEIRMLIREQNAGSCSEMVFRPMELFPVALLLSCTCLQQQGAQTGRWDKFGGIAPHPSHGCTNIWPKRVRFKKNTLFFSQLWLPTFVEFNEGYEVSQLLMVWVSRIKPDFLQLLFWVYIL